MNLPALCIQRPVLATVMSLLIVVLGVASLGDLPVRELPDVDSAVVSVQTEYSGAAPEIVDTDITEVIEGAVAGVSGIRSLSSSSQRGSSRTTIEFQVGQDMDQAANDVREAVARVRGGLPDGVEEPRISKNDSDADPVMRVSISSDRLDPAAVNDYAERYIVDRLATLEGVSQVQIHGERRYALRIWLDRAAMAARRLTVADVTEALQRNNLELPAGELESTTRRFTLRADTRLGTVEEFARLVVAQRGDYPVRLADIARVVRGVEDQDSMARVDGDTAVVLGVLRQSQANTVAVSQRVRAELDTIRAGLPAGMSIAVGSDDALFINASIREVSTTLLIAVAVVVLVIYLFLGSPRATLVPALTIPVAVVGTFMGIAALGFSINVLTLLALILAIGIVVDDAIVVLENIQRRLQAGEPPLLAAVRGSQQVVFAVIATSVVLIAVFVPISFLQGQVGRLFSEFGLVLAGAVLISTFVALSLAPMLCSRLLRADTGEGWLTIRLNRGFEALAGAYRRLLEGALEAPWLVLLVALSVAGSSFWLYQHLSRELTPQEDRGVFFIPLSTPQGSTLDVTDGQVQVVESLVAELRDSGEAESVIAISGRGNESESGFVVVRLADWAERERDQGSIVRSLIPPVSALPGARAFPVSPAGLGVRGSRNPVQVVIGGPDHESVQDWAETLQEAVEANPGLLNVELDFQENQPQLNLRIQRQRADDLGVSVETLSETLRTLFAGSEITGYIDRGREYPVVVQAEAEDRQDPSDVGNTLVRTDSGELIPLSALLDLEENAAAPTLRRYGRLPAITLSASLAEGYDLGTAIAFIQDQARTLLPAEANVSLTGQSRQFQETGSGVMLTFALALLIVFLVLAAQFESFIHPLIILLSVPLAVAGALLSLWLTGISLNIYSQIGIILLIGLTAKNGILIVEFANQLRDQGRDVREAIVDGAVLRLRAVLMTVVSTVLGALPLVLASGAGAESRVSIGVVVIGGLGLASLLTLVVIPVLYHRLAGFSAPTGLIHEPSALYCPPQLAKS